MWMPYGFLFFSFYVGLRFCYIQFLHRNWKSKLILFEEHIGESFDIVYVLV